MRRNEVRFDKAGKIRWDDIVFLTSEHRVHKLPTTIYHKNDYHTIIEIPREIFKKHFNYNPSTGIYVNLTGLTYQELGDMADIATIFLGRR